MSLSGSLTQLLSSGKAFATAQQGLLLVVPAQVFAAFRYAWPLLCWLLGLAASQPGLSGLG